MDPDERIEDLVAPLRADTLSGASEVARTAAEIVASGSPEHAGRVARGAAPSAGRHGSARARRTAVDGTAGDARPRRALLRRDRRLGGGRPGRGRPSRRGVPVEPRGPGRGRRREGGRAASGGRARRDRVVFVHRAGGDSSGRAVDRERRLLRGAPHEGGPLACEGARASTASTSRTPWTPPSNASSRAATRSSWAPTRSAIWGSSTRSAPPPPPSPPDGPPSPSTCSPTRPRSCPSAIPQIVEDDRPGSEVWEGAPAGVGVWNRYFEVVPSEAITGVVTENAVLSPRGVREDAAELEFPDALRGWAEGR